MLLLLRATHTAKKKEKKKVYAEGRLSANTDSATHIEWVQNGD